MSRSTWIERNCLLRSHRPFTKNNIFVRFSPYTRWFREFTGGLFLIYEKISPPPASSSLIVAIMGTGPAKLQTSTAHCLRSNVHTTSIRYVRTCTLEYMYVLSATRKVLIYVIHKPRTQPSSPLKTDALELRSNNRITEKKKQ